MSTIRTEKQNVNKTDSRNFSKIKEIINVVLILIESTKSAEVSDDAFPISSSNYSILNQVPNPDLEIGLNELGNYNLLDSSA